MEIIGFILLAGVWALFLLPKFFESRRHAPSASTRSFERSTALLAHVSARSTYAELMERRRILRRRQQILLGLGVAALAGLAIAILTGSVAWLIATLVVDTVLAAYITLLLQVKQRPAPAEVVQLRANTAPATAEHRSTVRIVAS